MLFDQAAVESDQHEIFHRNKPKSHKPQTHFKHSEEVFMVEDLNTTC